MSEVQLVHHGPRPPRGEHVIWGTIVALLVGGVLGSIAAGIGSVAPAATSSRPDTRALISPPFFLVALVLSSATFALLPLAAVRDARGGVRSRLLLVAPNVSGWQLALLLPATWTAWLAGWPLLWLGELVFPATDSLDWFIASYASAPWGWKAAFLVASSVGPGVGEEILFRGYLQHGLLRAHRTWVAVLITTSLFAAMHLPPARCLFVIPLSLWMSFLTLRTGSLVPAILCHTFVDLTGHLMIASETQAHWLFVVAGVIGLPAFVAGVRALNAAHTSNRVISAKFAPTVPVAPRLPER